MPIDETNLAYVNSLIGARTRLVYRGQASDEEGGLAGVRQPLAYPRASGWLVRTRLLSDRFCFGVRFHEFFSSTNRVPLISALVGPGGHRTGSPQSHLSPAGRATRLKAAGKYGRYPVYGTMLPFRAN